MANEHSPFKTLAAAAAVVVLLLLAALAAVSFDAPSLGATALHEAGERTGLTLQAESFRLNVFRGLRIEGLSAEGPTDAGRIDLQARVLVIRHRLLPLLQGRIVAKAVGIEQPEIRLTRKDRRRPGSDPAAERREKKHKSRSGNRRRAETGTAAPVFASSLNFEFELRIEQFRVRGGHVEVVTPRGGTTTAAISSLDLSLDHLTLTSDSPAPDSRPIEPGTSGEPRPILGASARGRLRADEVSVDTTRCENVSGKLELELGVARIFDFECHHAWGDSRIEELVVDLEPQPFRYEVRLSGEPLDSGLLAGMGPDSGMGSSKMKLVGTGVGPGRGRFRGHGTLAVGRGKLPAIPLLSDLDAFLGESHFVGTDFEPTEVRFAVEPRRIVVEPFEVSTGELRLQIGGTIDSRERLDLSARLSASRDLIELQIVPDEVLDVLADTEGRVSIPFEILGTRDQPRVIPQLPELTDEERKRIERGVKRKLKEVLDSLLSSERDD